MPKRDGTGPSGEGARTGKQQGKCAKKDKSDNAKRGTGRGGGNGRGRSNRTE